MYHFGGGRVEKFVSDNYSKFYVYTPEGVLNFQFNFLCGGDMDVFWNDPMARHLPIPHPQGSFASTNSNAPRQNKLAISQVWPGMVNARIDSCTTLGPWPC